MKNPKIKNLKSEVRKNVQFYSLFARKHALFDITPDKLHRLDRDLHIMKRPGQLAPFIRLEVALHLPAAAVLPHVIPENQLKLVGDFQHAVLEQLPLNVLEEVFDELRTLEDQAQVANVYRFGPLFVFDSAFSFSVLSDQRVLEVV